MEKVELRNEKKFVRFLVVDRSARLWITAWEPEAEVLLGVGYIQRPRLVEFGWAGPVCFSLV